MAKPFTVSKSFIKNIAIQLQFDFEFSNNPFEIKKEKRFAGAILY